MAAALRKQQIFRFQITEDDLFAVEMLEGLSCRKAMVRHSQLSRKILPMGIDHTGHVKFGMPLFAKQTCSAIQLEHLALCPPAR